MEVNTVNSVALIDYSRACTLLHAYMHKCPLIVVVLQLGKAGWTVADVDVWELNEAFAAQSIAVIRELGIQQDKVCAQSVAMGREGGGGQVL